MYAYPGITHNEYARTTSRVKGNVVLVLNADNETLRKYTLDTPRPASRDSSQRDPRAWPDAASQGYTWGLDLSQSIHGAGGIGGLLAAYETQGTSQTTDDKSYWFLYDANGNVGQALDATATDPIGDITRVAHYEYDPYGNAIVTNNSTYQPDGTLISTDTGYANANPFRFSTKWFDAETGLGYWGYRYYSPRLGRWISRDPVEEQSDLNLYLFVQNAPMNLVDYLGLLWGFTNCTQAQANTIRAAEAQAHNGLANLNNRIIGAILAREPYPLGTRVRLGVASAISICARARLWGLRVQCEAANSIQCMSIAYMWPLGLDNTMHICPRYFGQAGADLGRGNALVHEATHGCGTNDAEYFNMTNTLPHNVGWIGYEWIASSYDTWIRRGFCVPHYWGPGGCRN